MTDIDDDGMQHVAYFTVEGEPISKSRARFTGKGSSVRTYTPERTRIGEERVKAAYLSEVGRLETDKDLAFRVEADFYCGTRQRRDVDNMLKLILDGLNGVAWPDDVQVLEVSGRKSFVPRAEARTEVAVFRLDEGMARLTADCLRCGTPFPTYESWVVSPYGKRFCSTKCAYEQRLLVRERNCYGCGTSFTLAKPGDTKRFCSAECSSRGGKVPTPCAVCGIEFLQFKSLVERGQVYCSKECVAEHLRVVARARRSTRFPGVCLVCGAGTTRKEYKRCNACRHAGKTVAS